MLRTEPDLVTFGFPSLDEARLASRTSGVASARNASNDSRFGLVCLACSTERVKLFGAATVEIGAHGLSPIRTARASTSHTTMPSSASCSARAFR